MTDDTYTILIADQGAQRQDYTGSDEEVAFARFAELRAPLKLLVEEQEAEVLITFLGESDRKDPQVTEVRLLCNGAIERVYTIRRYTEAQIVTRRAQKAAYKQGPALLAQARRTGYLMRYWAYLNAEDDYLDWCRQEGRRPVIVEVRDGYCVLLVNPRVVHQPDLDEQEVAAVEPLFKAVPPLDPSYGKEPNVGWNAAVHPSLPFEEAEALAARVVAVLHRVPPADPGGPASAGEE